MCRAGGLSNPQRIEQPPIHVTAEKFLSWSLLFYGNVIDSKSHASPTATAFVVNLYLPVSKAAFSAVLRLYSTNIPKVSVNFTLVPTRKLSPSDVAL